MRIPVETGNFLEYLFAYAAAIAAAMARTIRIPESYRRTACLSFLRGRASRHRKSLRGFVLRDISDRS